MKTKYIIVSFLLFCFLSCNSTRITSTWKANLNSKKAYKKILVLGLIREADRRIQEDMEEHMTGDLIALGYNAIGSLKEYGPKFFEGKDEKEALKKLAESNIDAVITIVLLDKQKEQRYVPGHPYYSPYSVYYSRFWGYRTALYNRIYEPNYYVTDTKYFWESNLYDMGNQQLVYSVQTQSFRSDNSVHLGHEYGQLIVKDMVENNVLK